MGFKEFETLIGKEITIANQILLDEGFEHINFLEINSYTLGDDFKFFYGMPYKIISIMTDNKNTITSITIHLLEVIDSDFYNAFILDYGNPNTVQVVDKPEFIGEWKKLDKEFNSRGRKVSLIMKEGTFEENPLFMLWNKEDYSIKAFLRHEQNISEITFRVPTEGF